MIKSYRKFGAEANSRPRQAKFIAKYDRRNRTEFNWAITLREPMRRKSSTITKQTKTDTTGFPASVVPRVTKFRREPNNNKCNVK
jgi:hypothetical protein